MKVGDLINSLKMFDPDAQIGVLCMGSKKWHSPAVSWIHTDIAIESNGFGAMAQIAIVRTDPGATDGSFKVSSSMP